MTTRLIPTLAALFTLFVLAPLSATGSSTSPALIERLLLDLRDRTQVPAYSVAIVQNGELVAQSVVGEIDINNHRKAESEHWFRFASVSKIVGATMLAILVQQGEFDPNAPIGDYIEDLPDQFRDLTALQLLTHTSGLPHYQPQDDLIANTHYETATDTLASVGDRPLVTVPGTAYAYSSHGYTILGALHEAITQVPIAESTAAFVQEMTGRDSPALENIQRRNNLRSNAFDVTESGVKTLKPRDQSYSPFGTGFVGSATDLAFFGDAVLHSPLISDGTRDWMFKAETLPNGGKTGNYQYEVAFGWRVSKDPVGRIVYHHAGVTEGARSVLILYPESGLSVAFLSNASWVAQIERSGYALAATVLDAESFTSFSGSYAFAGSFDGEAISGSMVCKGVEGCLFSDDGGAFSEWMARYLPNKSDGVDWPAYVVQGEDGRTIKLVSSVGFIDLRQGTNNPTVHRYQAEIGNGRILDVEFSRMD